MKRVKCHKKNYDIIKNAKYNCPKCLKTLKGQQLEDRVFWSIDFKRMMHLYRCPVCGHTTTPLNWEMKRFSTGEIKE